MKRGKQRHFPLFLAGACTVLLLTGCGEKELVHTGTDTKNEEAAETEQEKALEVTEQTAGEAEAAEGKSAKDNSKGILFSLTTVFTNILMAVDIVKPNSLHK